MNNTAMYFSYVVYELWPLVCMVYVMYLGCLLQLHYNNIAIHEKYHVATVLQVSIVVPRVM